MTSRRRQVTIAATAVLCLAVGALTFFILKDKGYPKQKVDANDGGIWATSDHDGLFGRLNKPAGSLDAAFRPPGSAQQSYQLNVLQDRSAVIARDRASGQLFPVDVATGALAADNGVLISASEQIVMRGGSVAILNPASGKLWAIRVDPTKGISSLTGLDRAGKATATVGSAPTSGILTAAAALTIGSDGTVYAVSAAGRTAIVTPKGDRFAEPVKGDLNAQLQQIQVTAVGNALVIYDADTGTLILPGGKKKTLDQDLSDPVLQQPGPASDAVLIGTSDGLLSVDLDSGTPTTLSSAGTGEPAAPVRVGGCAYGSWVGTPGLAVRACGKQQGTAIALQNEQSLVEPEFRVNRGSALLNDLVSGAIWDLDTGKRVDNWADVLPPDVVTPKDSDKKNDPNNGASQAKPRAVADRMGARPGRTAVLNVLDNDSDPGGNILSISRVTAPDDPAAKLAVSPDGQTVQITMPESGDVKFRYTVNDGKGLEASADVSVQSRPLPDNKPPNQRIGYTSDVWNVASGGSIALPVIGDWRDFDGDSPLLASASATRGRTATTPDGRIDYTAPLKAGAQTITYRVTDGIDTTQATIAINVLPATSTTTSPARTQPDVARGQVGKPIAISPLDNDLPGNDPTTPDARLQLATEVVSPDGTTATTDLKGGTITLVAAHSGTYLFDYSVAYGNATYTTGAVRVDVIDPPGTTQPPVAMRDTAVLHGQQPVIVDVLANDFDPGGLLLTVQTATPASADQLQVAIVQGRWLQIKSLAPTITPNPQVIRYTITNGATAVVTGEVSVSQLPAPKDNTPIPRPDYATVRAADAVTIAVLDNDTSPSGDALTLNSNVTGAPSAGVLTVATSSEQTDNGSAYVTGNTIRYAAPTRVSAQRTVTVDYVVQNSSGAQAVGRIFITVNPPPDEENPDQAPNPVAVDARMVAGDTRSIRVTTSGVDPDGDSVSLVGIATAPALGRILSTTAGSLVYQAYPTAAGTDTFTYEVVDRYGKTGRATMRVAVTQPGDPQPPVAVDDILTASPGTKLTVEVLTNDLISAGDKVTINPLDQTNSDVSSATLASPTGPIVVTASKDAKPVVIRYGVSNGLAPPSVATLTVRSQESYNIPPIVPDTFPKAQGGDSITVDVLERASDPDGNAAKLTIAKVSAPGAKIDGTKITVAATPWPQVVPFEVLDADGASTLGLVFVPADSSGAPYTIVDQTISMDTNSTKRISIANYVSDPAGKPIALTTEDKLSASPSSGLKVAFNGEDGLTLTSQKDYVGPAAVTFQVTDGTSLTDPNGKFATITVPVQVGPETPVLRCPSNEITLVEGGADVSIDVTSLCHVWVANTSTLSTIKYTGAWASDPGGITIGGSGSATLVLTAGSQSAPGKTGTISIGVAGTDAVKAKINVRVVSAPPPSMAQVNVDGVVAGKSASVDVGGYVSSQLREPSISIVSIKRVSGGDATSSVIGSRTTLSPAAEAHGTIVFQVVISDVADSTRLERQATGLIVLNVLGVPDQPGTPTPDRSLQSHVATLNWAVPANNGAPIDSYELTWSGGKQICPGSPCSVPNLTNGSAYSFTVRAHNLVGWSKPSAASAPVIPNAIPGAARNLAVSNPRDGALTLTWTAAPVDGTAVLNYAVTWPGGQQSVTGTTMAASGLNNNAVTTFTVVAVNAAGPGTGATASGQSAGAPATPAAPSVTAVNTADQSARAVTISWTPISPNGPGPTSYTVNRTGGGGPKVVCTTTTNSCADNVNNTGDLYYYSLTAANTEASNGPGHTSPPGATTSMEAAGTPGPVTGLTATPTGKDGEATITFNVAPANGSSSTVSCTAGGAPCGTWSYPAGGQNAETKTIGGLPNGQPTVVTLQECNGSGAVTPCSAAASETVTTYGAIQGLTVTALTNGQNVNYTVSVNPNGKAVNVVINTSGGGGQTITTGTGPWTQNFTQTVGFNSPFTVTASANDGPRSAGPTTATGNTGDGAVAVSRGTATSTPDCTDPSCATIVLQLGGFASGQAVNCTVREVGGPSLATVSVTPGGAGNYTGDLPGVVYGSPGKVLLASCIGVNSPPYEWPT